MGCLGVKNQIPSCCLSVLLSPPKPLEKFNQIWCASYLHEWGMQRQFFLCPAPWGPVEGSKVKYHLISITKSISKIFVPNFVCVQNISDGIFILLPRSCPRGGTGGAQVVKKKKFKHGHVEYQINRDDKHNRMQVKILS